MNSEILRFILSIPAILVAFTFHEYAHAKMADKLGDKTPRFQGRLTLNPFAHIDIFGFLMIMFFKFGWAKPVQVNKGAFKNPNKDDLKVSLAGPLANLFIAIISAIIYAFYIKFIILTTEGALATIIGTIIQYIMILNVNIFVLNLLPIPGFDGFAILEDLFPSIFNKVADKIQRYQMMFFVLIIFAAGRIIEVPASKIIKMLYGLIKTIVGI